jgi:N-acetyl-anhydromuramyl-L-alanine amidase AmpD
MKEVFQQTPNISKGRTISPKGIVLHHTAGSYSGSVSWCLNPQSQVSYHCIVDVNGDRTVLAKDTQRAWHAGQSSFKGQTDCNSFMLGIAVSGDTNARELTKEELESVAQWCVDKMKLYGFGIGDITSHRVVSPGRKNDVSIKAQNDIICRIQEILAK